MTLNLVKRCCSKNVLGGILLAAGLFGSSDGFAQAKPAERAPSYPLITHTPYFSIWSPADALNDKSTTHWTGKSQALIGILQVDNQFYRFMGADIKDYKDVLPAGIRDQNATVRFTTDKPAAGWEKPAFQANSWSSGHLPISDKDDAPTKWTTGDIWIRRGFDFNGKDKAGLSLKIRHDDNIVVYLNGKEIYRKKGWEETYVYLALQKAIQQNIVKGHNVLAFHVRNTAGGHYFDAGLSREIINSGPKLLKAKQKSVRIEALQTIYDFDCGKVDLEVTFTSPLLLKDLDILSRPVSYINYQVSTKDGQPHQASVYLSASSDIAVNTPNQEVKASPVKAAGISLLKVGTLEQPMLEKKGDDVRIDWGYFYVGADHPGTRQSVTASAAAGIADFLAGDTTSRQKKLTGTGLSLNTIIDLGKIKKQKSVAGHMLVGYDEIYALQYFKTNLRPWWNRSGHKKFANLMATAAVDYDQVIRKVDQADKQIKKGLVQSGGTNYARLGILAYRQSIAAHNIVESPQHALLFLSKENFSNGSINTVDLTYPSSPLFLMYNTELLKGMMRGIFYYSESGRWQKPYAAHDLGTYPIANGQTYGEDMPIEEAGNMVILAAAITKVDKSAAFASRHWKTLSIWANYLAKAGFDPENQLCTDDFAGHLARNVNLSAKAIMAIRSYAYMADMRGLKDTAQKYLQLAKNMVPKWMDLAGDGDHYSLSFENKGTWSQKYNLVWDKVLDYNLFPKEVYQKEISYYLRRQNRYGLPLDSRKTYTKSDWTMWSATMAPDQATFEQFMAPLCRYIEETPDRVPLSDWHDTKDGKKQNFQARSVVGGYFMQAFNYWLHHPQ